MIAQTALPDVAFQYAVQGGFAAFALALLYVLRSTVQENNTDRSTREEKLITVLRETNAVISGNTAVITKVSEQTESTNATLQDIRDRLLERPCMLPRNNGVKI